MWAPREDQQLNETAALGPVSEVVRRRILDLISRGEVTPDGRLGGERELAQRLAVSRTSVRQALGALEAAGVVRRTAGRGGGTFLAGPKIDRDLSAVVGVPALLRRQGLQAGCRVLSASLVLVEERTAAALGLGPHDHVVDLIRIRLADGVPISLEHARFPADRLGGLLDHPLSGGIYELLEESFGLTPSNALERIEVALASTDEAAILGVRTGDPLLAVTRTTRDQDDVPFEYSHDLFRADRTSITVRTPGSGTLNDTTLINGRVLDLASRAAS